MAAGISPSFRSMLENGSSYQMVARLEVLDWKTGSPILDTANSNTTLYVVGGSIQVDGQASFSRVVQGLQIVDPTGTLIPKSKTDMFSPASNNELRLWVGAVVDGVPEYVSQGVFHLEGAKVEDSAEGLIVTLSAYDRARKYSRAKATLGRKFLASGDPTFPGGWPIYEAITLILRDAFTGTTVYHDNPSFLLPEQDFVIGDDPWETAREWAASMGYSISFDRYGDCWLRRIPDPSDPAQIGSTVHWTYKEGSGGLLGTVRDQSNESVVNGVAVTGVNPSNGDPVRSELIWDDDSTSATYYLGPYGKVPCFIQSDKVRTVAQANAMAQAELNKNKGLAETVEFTIVPNPAIDPLDLVKLTRPISGFNETGAGSAPVVVDRYTVHLSATGGAMTVTCRQRRA